MELYGDVVLRFVSGSFQVSCSPFCIAMFLVLDLPCSTPAAQGGLQTACLLCIMHRASWQDCRVVRYGTITRDMTVWGLHVQGPFLAGYTPVESPPLSYGIKRLDHAVGNVPKLRETLKYIAAATGFHEFAEFTAEVQFYAVCSSSLRQSTCPCVSAPYS